MHKIVWSICLLQIYIFQSLRSRQLCNGSIITTAITCGEATALVVVVLLHRVRMLGCIVQITLLCSSIAACACSVESGLVLQAADVQV